MTRNLITGAIESHIADAVCLATGGYGNVFYLSTNAKGSNTTAIWRAHKRGALFGNPCFTQIHPTCIPQSGDYQSKLTLMSESLRNDGRIWVPLKAGDKRTPDQIPESERDYYLERRYPSFGNLVPRDVASRAAKAVCDEGRGVGPGGLGVYLDFADAIKRFGKKTIEERYGNLFDMYFQITGENPYEVPMRIYPAVHYTMGGLWVDYNLMSTIPGLFVLGEANFSDHGANRLGASALMQGLADGYFVIPYTLGDYLATTKLEKVTTDHPEVQRAGSGRRGADEAAAGHQRKADHELRCIANSARSCGTTAAWRGTRRVCSEAIGQIQELREEFWQNVNVLGDNEGMNQSLEHAGRLADFLELGELMCRDALHREESCGGHFREEYQTPEGEAQRNDADFSYVAAWEFTGAEQRAGAPQGAADLRLRPSHASGATSNERNDETHFTSGGSAMRPTAGRMVTYETDGERAHVVSRNARRPQRATDARRAKIRSRSTTTAAKAFAAPADS